ncbi:MAG: hypothetical protein RLZZ458_85 [Planctomycetota bacterium]
MVFFSELHLIIHFLSPANVQAGRFVLIDRRLWLEFRQMLAQLIPRQGGPAITLSSAITVVGRSARHCDLILDHSSISKQHCMLVKTDGLVYIRDLGSTNGTRVNGQRVTRGALLPGDTLSFASVSYRVHLGADNHAPTGPGEATQWMPTIPGGDRGSVKPLSDSSLSDVRFLRDSDLLIPD